MLFRDYRLVRVSDIFNAPPRPLPRGGGENVEFTELLKIRPIYLLSQK